MALDTLEIFGDEFTNVAGIKATDSNSGTKVYIRPQGTKNITQNGTSIDVTEYASVNVAVDGGEYTRTVIAPQQNITTNIAYSRGYAGGIANYTETPVVGDMYLVTFDGTEYVCEGFLGDSTGYVIGDYRIYTTTTVMQYMTVPFACAYYSDTGYALVTRDTNTHTLKIEKLEFVEDGTTLISKNITANGTYNASSDSADGYASVTVNVSTGTPTIQSLTVTPSTTQQTFNASGVDGYKPVTVEAMPAMTLPTTAASSATSGYTSKATIGRSTAAQYINIPPGYNSTGAYYVISAVANGSATAPASISGTAASVSTGTNTLTLTKTVSVTPTVSAGYVSSGTAGNSSVSLTASVTTKAAATITPTTTNQTIAAGTYLTGAQTIVGDADLVGSNILSTANIFGVQGTVDFIDVYIRSAAPTSSVGSDGDIYIQE